MVPDFEKKFKEEEFREAMNLVQTRTYEIEMDGEGVMNALVPFADMFNYSHIK